MDLHSGRAVSAATIMAASPTKNRGCEITVSLIFLDTTEATQRTVLFAASRPARRASRRSDTAGLLRSAQAARVVAVKLEYQYLRFCHLRKHSACRRKQSGKKRRAIPTGKSYPAGATSSKLQASRCTEEPLGAKGLRHWHDGEMSPRTARSVTACTSHGRQQLGVGERLEKRLLQGLQKRMWHSLRRSLTPRSVRRWSQILQGLFRKKLLKGGSWYFTGDRMRGAGTSWRSPSNRGPHRLGFPLRQDDQNNAASRAHFGSSKKANNQLTEGEKQTGVDDIRAVEVVVCRVATRSCRNGPKCRRGRGLRERKS